VKISQTAVNEKRIIMKFGEDVRPRTGNDFEADNSEITSSALAFLRILLPRQEPTQPMLLKICRRYRQLSSTKGKKLCANFRDIWRISKPWTRDKLVTYWRVTTVG